MKPALDEGGVHSFKPRLPLVYAVVGVAVSVGFLVLTLQGASLAEVWRTVLTARIEFLVAGIALAFGACWAMGFRWKAILGPTWPTSTADAVDQVMIGNLAGLILPARLGDVARVLLIRQRWGSSGTQAAGGIVIERLSDVIVLSALALGLSRFVVLPGPIRVGLITLGSGAALALALLWLWASYGRLMFAPLVSRLPDSIERRIAHTIDRISDGVHAVRRPRQAWNILGRSVLIWSLSGLSLISYLLALEVPVPWYAGLMVLMFTNLAGVVPSSPGSIGVYHYFAVLALATWTNDRSVALGFALLSHLLTMAVTATAGILSLSRQGLSLRSFREQATSESLAALRLSER